MKKILIVTEYFAPNNEIAAVRTTKLAKYFKLKGNHVGVVTRSLRFYEIVDPILHKELKYIDEYVAINVESMITKNFIRNQLGSSEGNLSEHNVNIANKAISKLLSSLLMFYLKTKFSGSFDLYLCRQFIRKTRKYIKRLSRQYDVILTSSGPFSVNILGDIAKRKNPDIMWIADFRDPLINSFPWETRIKYYLTVHNIITERADVITGVSDICVENFKDCFKGRIDIISNGFDEDDLSGIDVIRNEKFVFTYAGTLYHGKQNLSVIFNAISELIKEGSIKKDNIKINYLGNEVFYFASQAGVEFQNICYVSGKVDRELSLQQQLSSNILLLASWNHTGYTGVITGKFLEYMMINKPIICTVTGNLPESQLKKMIEKANSGIVWEQANNEIDYPKMKDYILKQYKRYEAGLSLDFTPNLEYINQFKYDNIANKFIEIINKAL